MSQANMASTDVNKAKSAPKNKIAQEQIVAGLQELKQAQQTIASKISELEMEKREHEWVSNCSEWNGAVKMTLFLAAPPFNIVWIYCALFMAT